MIKLLLNALNYCRERDTEPHNDTDFQSKKEKPVR